MVTLADGMIMPMPDRYIWETDQKAVIFYEDGMQTMVLSVSYEGNAEDFAWIVPTPTRPEVTKSSDELFTSLHELTAVEYGYENYSRSVGLGDFSGVYAPQVRVVETKTIDYYDVAVLEATNASALKDWLNDNGYQYPDHGTYILKNYIDNGWYFTAVKLTDEYLKGISEFSDFIEEVEGCTDSDRGLNYFEKGKVFTANTELVDYCRDQYVLVEYSCVNDRGAEGSQRCQNGCLNGACIQNHNQLSSGHATPLRFDFDTDKIVYPMKISSIQSEENANQSRYRGRYETMGVLLYVIADNKQELPGFETKYAGWIKKDTIEDLAFDDSGEAWFSPSEDKYFISKLYRSMTRAEMNSDLYLRQAGDNSTVNAPDDVADRGFMPFIIIMIIGGLLMIGLLVVLLVSGIKKDE